MATASHPASNDWKYTESPKNTIWMLTNCDDIPRAIKQHYFIQIITLEKYSKQKHILLMKT